MEVTKEMMKRHEMSQKALEGVKDILDGLTIVEALGVLKLAEASLVRFVYAPEQTETAH